jgi:rare lipoprotein A
MRSVICLTLLLLVCTTVYANVKNDSSKPGKHVQAGVASWYGKNFHGKTTSSGEAFNMYSMTAAHNTIPNGQYVRVVNKKNGRKAVVRINDRGPLISGRIIDLSYSAARDLGMLESGLSPVTIETLGYRDKIVRGKAINQGRARNDRGLFGIQVGAYSNRENAEILAKTIRKRFDPVIIHEAEVNGEAIFRVRVGKYTSMQSAKQQLRRICSNGDLSGFVTAL